MRVTTGCAPLAYAIFATACATKPVAKDDNAVKAPTSAPTSAPTPPPPARSAGPYTALPSELSAPIEGEVYGALFDKLTPPPKDQFETTAAYRKRTALAPDNAWHVMRISQPCDRPRATYNADEHRASIQIPVQWIPDIGDRLVSAICVRKRTGTSSSYEGTNAFGAHATVAERTDTVDFVYATALAHVSPLKEPMITFPMSVDSARATLQGLEPVLFFQLAVTKPADTHIDITNPTIDNPERVLTHSREIDAVHLRIAVVDARTGKILAWRNVQ